MKNRKHLPHGGTREKVKGSWKYLGSILWESCVSVQNVVILHCILIYNQLLKFGFTSTSSWRRWSEKSRLIGALCAITQLGTMFRILNVSPPDHAQRAKTLACITAQNKKRLWCPRGLRISSASKRNMKSFSWSFHLTTCGKNSVFKRPKIKLNRKDWALFLPEYIFLSNNAIHHAHDFTVQLSTQT